MMGWLTSAWFWWALALALFALETMAPGAFMLWIGFAAAATAAVVAVLPLSAPWQWSLFAALAVISGGIGWRRRLAQRPRDGAHRALNQRAQQLLGGVYPLERAIVDGRGRVKIGDAYWAVAGEDLPVGTRVRVVGTDGVTLRVSAEGPVPTDPAAA